MAATTHSATAATSMAATATAPATTNAYESEWFSRVNGDLAESARLHQSAAVMFERIAGRMDLQDAKIEVNTGQIKALQNGPVSIRNWAVGVVGILASTGGCLSLILSGILGSLTLLISVASLVLYLTGKH